MSNLKTIEPFWVRHFSRHLQFLLDLAVLAGAFALAYALRFDFEIPTGTIEDLVIQLPLVVLVQFSALSACGIYAFIWRYVGMAEVESFIKASLYSTVPLLVLRLTLPASLHSWRVPLSVTMMDAVLAFGGLLAVRILRRAVYERFEKGDTIDRVPTASPQRTLLVGAGRAGMTAIKELSGSNLAELEVIGFLDDDVKKQGSVIQGIKVLGTTDDLSAVVEEHKISLVVVTMVRASRETLRMLFDRCQRLGVDVRIMPSLFEILHGRLDVSRFRQIRIEDVLGREPVRLDEDPLRRFMLGRRILITGAGGSIGSELARQSARFFPQQLALVERAEPALFEIHRELKTLWPDLDLCAIVADASDDDRMREVFKRCKPQLVLHASAHKHVPLMESNPGEAISNNSLTTHRLGRLAGEIGVERFVLISTDKAVRPSSIMGASKRLAELFVQDLDKYFDTSYMAVRFGNVLESTGSVIPIFREQIERGGPVTVTHPDMVRYFMTIPEAAQLVLQAAELGKGGEIFVLDMGEPVKIVDLARDMIRLAGWQPEEEIEIQFTGLRPGEKLAEELELENENLAPTPHPKVLIGKIQPPPREWRKAVIPQLEELSRNGSENELRSYLSEIIPEAQLDKPS